LRCGLVFVRFPAASNRQKLPNRLEVPNAIAVAFFACCLGLCVDLPMTCALQQDDEPRANQLRHARC
jgi:hypothetical protein